MQNNTVFRDVTPCTLVEILPTCVGTCNIRSFGRNPTVKIEAVCYNGHVLRSTADNAVSTSQKKNYAYSHLGRNPKPHKRRHSPISVHFLCQIFIQIILSYFRSTFNIHVHQLSLILVMFKLKIHRGIQTQGLDDIRPAVAVTVHTWTYTALQAQQSVPTVFFF